MGVNWKNVIKNQMHGMDPVSAYNKEEQRLRKQRAEEYRELVEMKNVSRSQKTKCTETGI